MDGMGVGALTSVTGTNIMTLKKAIDTQESLLGRILESASSQGLQSPAVGVSDGARSAAAESTQRGVGLDLSA